MKERNHNCCTMMEDGLAWAVGWIEGCILGCIYGCSENKDDTNMANEMFRGAISGFREGEWLGHMDG